MCLDANRISSCVTNLMRKHGTNPLEEGASDAKIDQFAYFLLCLNDVINTSH
jgi:hypothetical protein